MAPAATVESPEPTYTAETLMRRCSGVNAALLLGTVNYLLLSAAQRGRLGASTFRALNGTACLETIMVRAVLRGPRCLPYRGLACACCHHRPHSLHPCPARAGPLQLERCHLLEHEIALHSLMHVPD